MNVEQLQQEVGRALADKRLKEHQRRSVAAVVIMATCSVEEAIAGIEHWTRFKKDYAKVWRDGIPARGGCSGYLEEYATHAAFEIRKSSKLPVTSVTSLADFRRAKERRDG